ncbi:MAG: ComEC/Rec2 family competence protein [Phycisphaerales bacterium]
MPLETLGAQRRRLVSRARLRTWTLVACFAIGIALARFASNHGVSWSSWWGFVFATVLTLIASVSPARAARGLMVLVVVVLGGSVAQSRIFERPRDDLGSQISVSRNNVPEYARDAGVIDLEGFLPATWEKVPTPQGAFAQFQIREPSWSTDLHVRRALIKPAAEQEPAWTSASGTVRVVVKGDEAPTSRAGDTIRVTGQLLLPDLVENPGDEKRLLFEAQDRFTGILRCTSASLIQEVPSAGLLDSVRSLFAQSGAAMRARLQRVLDSASGSQATQTRQLMGALLLGEHELERSPVGLAYTRLGLSHILTISGFHLTVLALTGLWAIRLFGDRGWLEPVLVALLVIVYILALPAQSPIIRSALMVLSLLATDAIGRKYDRVCVLAWVSLALLIWRPADLWSLGFQLSVGLTAMLLWAGEFAPQAIFGTKLRGTTQALDNPGLGVKIKEAVTLAIGNGAMCWLTSMPVIASTTGIVSVAGMIASLLLAPVFVVLLWIGYITLLAGLVVPAVAAPVGIVLAWLCEVALRAAVWMDTFQFSSVRIPPIPFWWAIPATAFIALCWRMWSGWTRASRRNAMIFAALWSLALVPIALLARGLPSSVALRVDMLAVGDGSCYLIRSGTDAMLWDAKALPPRGTTPRTAGICRELGAWRVRSMLITHPDLDHMGGVLDVIEPLGVQEVLIGTRLQQQATQQPEGAAAVMLKELAQRNIRVRVVSAGDELTLGHARINIVSPRADADWRADNEHSLVGLIEAPRSGNGEPARLLMTGDAGELAITALEQTTFPSIDAMELPHHGSAQPIAMDWVSQLQPRVILQSTGPSRVDDPRWDPTRVKLTDTKWFVTPKQGWSSVTWNHDGSIVTQSMR